MSDVLTPEGTADPRFCRILVLSPGLRSNRMSAGYKPFNDECLLVLFEEVAKGVAERHRDPLFRKHALYSNFFFGTMVLAEEQIAELRALPSAILDCTAMGYAEPDAASVAAKALREFMYDAEPLKPLILVCRDHCTRQPPFNHRPTYSDEELKVALWSDLVGNLFEAVARQWMARRAVRRG